MKTILYCTNCDKTTEIEDFDPRYRYFLCEECKTKQIYVKSGVGERFYGCNFDTYDVDFNNHKSKMPVIYDAIKINQGLIFSGSQIGIGKTHLAIASLIEYCMKDKIDPAKTIFIQMRDYDIELTTSLYNNMNSIIESVKNKKIVILDEMGRESEKTRRIIEMVIDNIYNHNKILIGTTNLNIPEFKKFYDNSIIDRITNMCQIIQLTGKSWRQK